MVIADKVAAQGRGQRQVCAAHHYLLEDKPRADKLLHGYCLNCKATRTWPNPWSDDVLRPEFRKHKRAGHGAGPMVLEKTEESWGGKAPWMRHG